MLQYQAYPCIGHLEVLYHIFAYLKIHMMMGRVGYDPMGPNVDFSVFNDNVDWTVFTGPLRKNYCQRCCIHVVWLQLIICLLVLTIQVLS